MWIYSQSSGQVWDSRGACVGEGYSGFEEGKNNPKLEAVRDLGPIPRGLWVITNVYDSPNVGPYTLTLIPSGHNALMRRDFRVHGQSKSNFGRASKGCIVLPRTVRELIWQSGDRQLRVIG